VCSARDLVDAAYLKERPDKEAITSTGRKDWHPSTTRLSSAFTYNANEVQFGLVSPTSAYSRM
jgi:hypothetical protein